MNFLQIYVRYDYLFYQIGEIVIDTRRTKIILFFNMFLWLICYESFISSKYLLLCILSEVFILQIKYETSYCTQKEIGVLRTTYNNFQLYCRNFLRNTKQGIENINVISFRLSFFLIGKLLKIFVTYFFKAIKAQQDNNSKYHHKVFYIS